MATEFTATVSWNDLRRLVRRFMNVVGPALQNDGIRDTPTRVGLRGAYSDAIATLSGKTEEAAPDAGAGPPTTIDQVLQYASAVDAGTGEARPTEPSCEHGTALDVHCCNCHSGFIFETDHECPELPRPAPLDLAAVLTDEHIRQLHSDCPRWGIAATRTYLVKLLTPWLAARSAESAQQIAELEAQVTSLCNADAERVRMVSEWRLRSQEWEQDAKRSNARLAEVAQAARALRRDANRLCDRMLGGTYEADMRRTIAEFDAVLSRLPATGEGPAA